MPVVNEYNLNSKSVFVFVRQDLPLWQQLAHSNHAMFGMVAQWRGTTCGTVVGIPFVVVIGLPDEKAMNRVVEKLMSNILPSYYYIDPDTVELGRTAIATFPLSADERKMLVNYRLWNEKNVKPMTMGAAQ